MTDVMAPNTPSPGEGRPLLGDVVVTGGSGFLGYHLVAQLLADPECGAVHVLDRVVDESRNHHAGATYHACSVEDAPAVRALLASVRPRAVFHCASPNFSFPDEAGCRRGRKTAADQFESNVEGTRVLLDEARRCGSVGAFVFASTIDMYRDPPHVDGDETLPTWADADDDGPGLPEEAYARSKAAAHKLVLAANEPDADASTTDARRPPPLKTASLVLAHMYGERDSQMLRTMLETTALPGAPFVRIGDGSNLTEVVDVANAAAALRLAAKALLDPARAAGRVDGEAFNVSDDHPVLFWHHVRVMFDAAQRHYGTPGEPRVFVLPGWLMWAVVWIVDWALRIFTLGRVRPPVSLSRLALLYALYTHTYSTRKIRERLGFKPVADHDAVIAAAVERELKRRDAEKEAVKKVA